jgi:hypothetical protein
MDAAITTAIASALATKATDAATSAGHSAWAALVRLVRSKLPSAGNTPTVLQSAVNHPDDPASIGALAEALAQASADDPHFATQLRALWDTARTELATGDDGIINQISGTVHGNVIQARDVTMRANVW